MIARNRTIEQRFVPPPKPWLEGQWRVAQFTRFDADAMMRLGIIPEDASTELLHGVIVLKDRAARGEDPTMIGQDHRKCVERFSALRKSIDNPMRHVESQQPLGCSEIHVPEPDFMVLRGTLDDYTDLPNAGDAWCVVEVADASYERDVVAKLFGYAQAGVRQYIIVDLRNRTAEVYTNADSTAGTYPPPQVVTADQSLSLRVGDDEFFNVLLQDLLP